MGLKRGKGFFFFSPPLFPIRANPKTPSGSGISFQGFCCSRIPFKSSSQRVM